MQTETSKLPKGMAAFIIIWITQFLSVMTSTMSHFALSIFMYQQTESATAMGLLQVFFITPFLLISPLAGVMVDRYSRKLMMALSDIAAGVATVFILVMSAAGQLEFWHLYIAAVLNGVGNAFQWPAYSAAISTMVPKEQLGRVNGMMSLIEAGPGVIAPLLAGVLLPIIGLTGVLVFDVVTFGIAVLALMLVFIPNPERTVEGAEGQGSMLKEAAYGFKYIFARPSLLGLQLTFFTGNLFAGIAGTLVAPMILARTNSDSLIFGSVQTAGAVGGIIGGIIMSAWGGTKKKVHGVLIGWFLSGLFGMVLFGLGSTLWWWAISTALYIGLIPWVNGSNQAIWQAKVAPDVQGRVFSARRLIAWFTNPISPIIAGTLADFVLEPAMRSAESPLAQTFGGLVGTGIGSGMSLLIIFCGAAAMLVGLAGYFVPAIRNAEDILPDHDQIARVEEPASA